jgi:hypothetical protein
VIVVKLELWSAVTGRASEIGRMYIANDGRAIRSAFPEERTDKRGDLKADIERLVAERDQARADARALATYTTKNRHNHLPDPVIVARALQYEPAEAEPMHTDQLAAAWAAVNGEK